MWSTTAETITTMTEEPYYSYRFSESRRYVPIGYHGQLSLK